MMQPLNSANGRKYWKKTYYLLFTGMYLLIGCTMGIPQYLFKTYLIDLLGGSFDSARWLRTYSIGMIPWALQFIISLGHDKLFHRFSNRRIPFILGFAGLGALIWIITSFNLPQGKMLDIYFEIGLVFFLLQLSMAGLDTALNGFILDVVPSREISKIQAVVKSNIIVGMGVGAFVLGDLFISNDILNVLFLIMGISFVIIAIFFFFVKEPQNRLEKQTLKEFLQYSVLNKQTISLFLWILWSSGPLYLIIQMFNLYILSKANIIAVQNTTINIISGNALDVLQNEFIFSMISGAGTLVGQYLFAYFAKHSYRKAILFNYFLYIPVLIGSWFILGLITGNILHFFIGIAQGIFSVGSATIRSEISRRHNPYYQTTYFSFMSSAMNLGGSIGMSIGSLIIEHLPFASPSFQLHYLFIIVFCVLCLSFSFLAFRKINPKKYELQTAKTPETLKVE